MSVPTVKELVERAVAAKGVVFDTPISERKLVICNQCGWAHLPIAEIDAIEQSSDFNDYYKKLPREDQVLYYGGHYDPVEAVSRQKKCFHCGNVNTDFHVMNESDNIPDGVTIQGVIFPE